MAPMLVTPRPSAQSVVRLLAVVALLFSALLARPAMAQQILRDAETDALFRDISAPLVEAAGMRPEDVEFVLINDSSINAFVAGGQRVYIHSGLIMEADHVGQVQGVVAHELGHVAGGHIIRFSDGAKQATSIQIISLLLGAAAIAAGSGEAGIGIMQAGQRAALGTFLAFNRAQESSADQAGAKYLSAAGISGRGSLEFFSKLQNQEYRLNISQDNSYDRTHPLSRERIAALEGVYHPDASWNVPNDAELEARFQRVKAKLIGYVNPQRALRDYPRGTETIPALFARAYAYHQGVYPDQAIAEAEKLATLLPNDPFALELWGQILLENGRPEEALPVLRRAVDLAPQEPLIATTFGHALIATEDTSRYAEAKPLLKAAVQLDRRNPFAWYQLGVIYEAEGDASRAALASAERMQMLGQHRAAYVNATRAMAGIETRDADWIRAQDIALTSRHALEEEKEKVPELRR